MILLTVNNVTKHYGPEPVLDGVTFDVRSGQRIALVGPNGAGKTTLMRILTHREQADAGAIELHSSSRIGYLEQQPDFTAEETVWQVAREALAELIQLSHRAEQLATQIGNATDEEERTRLGVQFDHLQHELHRRDGYHIDHKIERVLHGLGFNAQEYHQPVQQLSGGQQNRLLLARLLLEEPDLMLLDEPSNHLDIEATEWLENFLVQSRQAILVVSHDRYFLDKVTDRTLELYSGTVDSYRGNFTAYQKQKVERLEVQRRTYENQQAEIAKLEDFVRRHSYGQKHAQAEDRRKKLERIEHVELPREITAPPMGFPPATRSGDIVLRTEHLSKAYDRPLFADLTFDIERGEKWGILGPNGSGKTTLLRCLLGQQEADEGRVIFGTGVKVAYFDQLLESVDANAEAVDAIRPDHKEFVEGQRRDLLARFGVTGDMVFQKVHSLSGGERNRVALALLAASDANFLILDEPTNHLDLWARGALERAITKFDGTVLFVSHDRYFLNQVADHLLVVEPDRFRTIQGDYDTYLHLVDRGLAGGTPAVEEKKTATAKQNKNENLAKRRRKFPYRKAAEIEADIHTHEEEIARLHEALADPDVLRDGNRVKEATVQLQQNQQKLATLYEHWEEASELN